MNSSSQILMHLDDKAMPSCRDTQATPYSNIKFRQILVAKEIKPSSLFPSEEFLSTHSRSLKLFHTLLFFQLCFYVPYVISQLI